MRLADIEVNPTDCRRLVKLLIGIGNPHDITAAGRIDRGLRTKAYSVALNGAQQQAILAALDEPPAGLAELRRKLLHDHLQRTGQVLVEPNVGPTLQERRAETGPEH